MYMYIYIIDKFSIAHRFIIKIIDRKLVSVDCGGSIYKITDYY
jgi:hypothetical protein